MPKIHFVTQNITVQAEAGATILEAARAAGVVIESPCNAVGVCGKCRVRLVQPNQLDNIRDEGAPGPSFADRAAGYILSCRSKVYGDIDVIVPGEEEFRQLRILTGGDSFPYTPDPYITKRFQDGVTEVYGGGTLLGTEPGDTSAHIYGIALDIGATTLVAELLHLPSGESLASESMLNPQSVFAQDVLTRIHFAAQEGGLSKLHEGFLSAFAQLRDKLIKDTAVDPRHIYEVVYSGNTTMLHLAAGIDPASLGRYPYTPVICGGNYLAAGPLGISPFGLIYLPPIISAYVGADITSGILATRLEQKSGAVLFIDIGTNGEIVLAHDGRLTAASTAAGPAFEGMNIVCGMRAAPGAIERFQIASGSHTFTYTVIGLSEAVGICGSGLLDIVGELVRTGLIDKRGRLARPGEPALSGQLQAALREREDKPVFYITPEVFLTQQDIRQVQLAKGAIRAGIEALLARSGLVETQVQEVLIAGAFGYHLRESSLFNIGLISPAFAGKIRFVGNTSQSGAAALLLNQGFRTPLQDLAAKTAKVDLADTPGFEKLFISCLEFD
ncbi:MAG: ASKHA domain-containing protein [Clostridia bacterium]|jgi:uncharacterized 2Fe-2S/4Fe-4S cluster protein (DUF4445 family)|nr:ASKHA domain-containing protein [Clostridia bacterium]